MYVSTFSRETPIRLCCSLITNRKWSLTDLWLCCFPYPTNSPVFNSHVWNHGRFLHSAPQCITQLRTIRGFYGLGLAGQPCFQLFILQARKDLGYG